ncbi:MAG: methyl-accepting chemotaxis protein [bacterium]
MKRLVNLFIIATNLPALFIGLPILILLVPETVHFTGEQVNLLVKLGSVIGILLAVEYDILQKRRFSNTMKNENIKKPEMREYVFMMNSPTVSGFHMFMHFILGSVLVGGILIFTGAELKSVIIGIADGLLIAVFMGLVNMQVSYLVFSKKLMEYRFTMEEMKSLSTYLRKIPLVWRFLITVNFMFLFVIYVSIVLKNSAPLFIVLIAANIALSYIFLLSILTPIKGIKQSVKSLFSTDMHKLDMMPVVVNDEIGEVIEEFNLTISKYKDFIAKLVLLSNDLSSITSQLASTGEEITASSEEVSATIQNIAKDMENQSSNTKNAKEDALKIKTLSESVSSKINMAQTASKKANEATTLGLNKVDNTMNSFDEIVSNVTRALNKIEYLQKRSEQINEIVEIITKISEQTDLLALNTAIEAARVGEFGKGFAVVAEEIRELAEQSSQSTERISHLINEIKSDILTTAEIIQNQHKNVSEGKALMDETKQEFQQISKAITLTVNMIKEISYSSEEQMSSITKYIQNISQIAELSERTSSNTEEIAASMEQQTASMEEILSNVQEVDQKANQLKSVNEKIKETS